MTAKLAYYERPQMREPLARHYLARLASARRVLDLGCGVGEFGKYRPPEMELYGIDSDAAAVKRAGRFETAVCHDVTTGLPYPSGFFDGVLARDIFEHLADPASLAREAHRVLVDGGRMIVSVVNERPWRVWADYTHVRGFTKAAARAFLEDSGFVVRAVWPMGPVPLAVRFNLIRVVPHALRMPVLYQLWASSWELEATKS